ncbi:hypothetical protein TNCV_2653161 [Trichonephila clavipes]|nr:hypothetical protein TNCV_2653161 [Trichonephila clavipes]
MKGIRGEMSHSDTKSKVGRFAGISGDLKFRQDSVEAYFVLLERDLKFRQDSVEAYFVLLERDIKFRQDSEARNAII